MYKIVVVSFIINSSLDKMSFLSNTVMRQANEYTTKQYNVEYEWDIVGHNSVLPNN